MGEQSPTPVGLSEGDPEWDTPGASSEPATRSFANLIKHEVWGGFQNGDIVKVVDPKLKSLERVNCVFLCHTHIKGQPGGWVDVYNSKRSYIIAVDPTMIRLVRRRSRNS